MLTHKQKVRLARKMRTPAEIRRHVPLFETDGWDLRKKAIVKRVQAKKKV